MLEVTLEPDEPQALCIPYGSAATPRRRFFNLKADLGLIAQVPELVDCPELERLIRAANGPESRFCTFGCEQWIRAPNYGPCFTAPAQAGAYVDLAFDTLELAMRRENYERLYEALQAAVGNLAPGPIEPDGSVRLRLDRVWIEARSVTVWGLAVGIFASGRVEAEAVATRRRLLQALETVLSAQSALINREHRAGRTGLLT